MKFNYALPYNASYLTDSYVRYDRSISPGVEVDGDDEPNPDYQGITTHSLSISFSLSSFFRSSASGISHFSAQTFASSLLSSPSVPYLVPFPRILHPLRDHPFFFLPNSPVANSRVQLQQNLNTSEFSTPVDRKIPHPVSRNHPLSTQPPTQSRRINLARHGLDKKGILLLYILTSLSFCCVTPRSATYVASRPR